MSLASDASVCSSHSLNGMTSFILVAQRPIAQYRASLWTTEARSMDVWAAFRLLLPGWSPPCKVNRSTHEQFLGTSSTREVPRIRSIGYIFALAIVPRKPKVEDQLCIVQKRWQSIPEFHTPTDHSPYLPSLATLLDRPSSFPSPMDLMTWNELWASGQHFPQSPEKALGTPVKTK